MFMNIVIRSGVVSKKNVYSLDDPPAPFAGK